MRLIVACSDFILFYETPHLVHFCNGGEADANPDLAVEPGRADGGARCAVLQLQNLAASPGRSPSGLDRQLRRSVKRA